RRARLRIAKAFWLRIALPERQYKSFDQTFSPRRARLRIAKAFWLRIALPERQYKSFDQTFSKVCGSRAEPLSLVATSETPQRSGSGRWEFEERAVVCRANYSAAGYLPSL
ncbi:MAG: hypothetical protein IKI45_11415, partial [Oscillospiraceae bacterium]|nr:hypothetical protein [Oscillospiraceae bacterium]